MRRPEVSKAFHVGFIIASYADADGGGAFPSAATIGAIAGYSEDTVTRCVRLLAAVGLIERTRRPNKSAVYQLLIPTQRPDWKAHMDVWGESRQARARRKVKEREMAELLAERQSRNPSGDGIRNPSAAGVPEPVPGGVPNPPGTRPRTGLIPVPGRVPEPVPGGGDQYIPTSGRDPHPDHDMAEPEPQPQVRAGTQRENDHSPPEPAAPDFRRCTTCGDPMAPRPGRTTHTHCTPTTKD